MEAEEDAKTSSKLEAVALVLWRDTLAKLEQVAQDTVRTWLAEHFHAIGAFPEATVCSA